MKTGFQQKLINWYSINKRELPWRGSKDPYTIWLSEVILQQTQVKQGLPYFLVFKNNFPSVLDLARASEQEVLKLWQGLGYYSRARNLHKTAKIVEDAYNGEFPKNYEELIQLPGIGDYTASAISSICIDEPHAVVDGNVYRFYSRYFGIDTPVNSSKAKKEFKMLAQDLLPAAERGEFNQAVMEFGSRHCRPKSPGCESCVFSSSCFAHRYGKTDQFPVKIRKQKIRNRYFNYLLVQSNDNNRILMRKREHSDIWQNLYEFPLVETQLSVDDKSEYITDQLSEILKGDSFHAYLFNQDDITHKLSHQHIHTKFWIVETDSDLSDGIDVSMVNQYPVPVLIQDFIEEYGLKE
ncbi:MAG: A/G-specific adenine glycosylase [Flavobacteriaceae bacterium]|nr:A/G-specific adenine glycosylase [Bacteroidia bacterium]NNK70790.1 A/G-specific adenine glycosylase [Flavobacteriaceae bacterium]